MKPECSFYPSRADTGSPLELSAQPPPERTGDWCALMAFPLAAIAGAISNFAGAGAAGGAAGAGAGSVGSVLGSVGSAASMMMGGGAKGGGGTIGQIGGSAKIGAGAAAGADLFQGLKGVVGGLANQFKQLVSPVNMLTGGAGALTQAFSLVKGMLGPVISSFEKVRETLLSIVSTATHFTQALDPAIVAQLNRSFEALNAVVGIAMRPIVAVADDVVKHLGGTLIPVMKALSPIVSGIANAFGSGLKAGINNAAAFLGHLSGALDGAGKRVTMLMDAWATLIDAVRPMYDALGTFFAAIQDMLGMEEIANGLMAIFKDLADASRVYFEILGTVMKTVIQTIGAMFGSDMKDSVKDFMASFRDAIQQTIKSMILFVAQLFKLVGFTKGLDAILRGLNPKPVKAQDPNELIAAQNAQFKGISEAADRLRLASFTASAYQKNEDEQKKPEQWLADISTKIEELKNGPASEVSARLERAVTAVEGLVSLGEQILAAIPTREGVLTGAKGFAAGVVSTAAPGLAPLANGLNNLLGRR